MIIYALFFIGLAFGRGTDNGNVAGNGGNTVVCSGAAARSPIFAGNVAISDIFEGEFSGYTYKRLVAFRGQNFEASFPAAVEIFLKNSSFRKWQVMTLFSQRDSFIHFVPETMSVQVMSSPAIWRSCHLEQVAMQYAPVPARRGDPMVLKIDSKIWKGAGRRAALPTDQKIALLFHEFILRDHLVGANTSCSYADINPMIGFLLSDQALAASVEEWNRAMDPRCDTRSAD